MAKFLTRAEVYRIIQRELPPEVYPDGAPSTFWSTADSDATAKTVSSLYDNMERIHENQWPQTADERLVDWEIKVFGQPLTGALTKEERQQKVLLKLQARPTLNPTDMRALVAVYLGPLYDPYVWDYLEWGCGGSASGNLPAWSLGISQLGYDTYLVGGRGRAYGPDACDQTAADLGLTDAQFASVQAGAATVEVRIFERTIDATVKADLQTALDRFGRATRRHLIDDNVRYGEFLTMLPSTSLFLIADDWATQVEEHGHTYWYDRSPAQNHARTVGVGSDAQASNMITPVGGFLNRSAIYALSAGQGFHAPGDDFNASTTRTYEVVCFNGNVNLVNSEAILARMDGSATQIGNILYRGGTGANVESAFYDSTATKPWIGSDSYTTAAVTLFGLPVLYQVVINAPERSIVVYRNGVVLVQSNNFLFGSLATPTGLDLGILGRWNGSALQNTFSGSILEVARHEIAMSPAMIAARAAPFAALKGY